MNASHVLLGIGTGSYQLFSCLPQKFKHLNFKAIYIDLIFILYLMQLLKRQIVVLGIIKWKLLPHFIEKNVVRNIRGQLVWVERKLCCLSFHRFGMIHSKYRSHLNYDHCIDMAYNSTIIWKDNFKVFVTDSLWN